VAARPSSPLTHWGRVRTAVVWEVLTAALDRLVPAADAAGQQLHILDAGGGTGGFAVPLARLGHRVTVVDPSPDSLASLERRAAEEDVAASVHGVQGDLDSLLDVVPAASVDVVLCHNVLEVVDDPAAGLRRVAGALRPGGFASVLATNRTAAVFSRVLSGRFDEAAAALADADGRYGPGDAVQRRFSLAELTDLLAEAGLGTPEVHGIRIFTELVAGGLLDSDPAAFEALVRLEVAAAERSPYREIATQLHLLAATSR
jgi:SAM-dependent methyltransferase